MKADKMIEKLIKKTVYVVDPLPEKVPKKSRGQYFEVEYFWHESGEAEKICRKFERIILKLNCYYDMDVKFKGKCTKNPSPKKMQSWIRKCVSGKKDYMNILLNDGEAMIILNEDDTILSVYNPNETLLALLEKLAAAEGLFVRKIWDVE
ncbi:hypothetical protein [Eubacterium sp. An3]|uniref:hypothetical protein n=1 Tax=Eubacterium sp. An3 TaxID=1965628 RepID=UPI000B366674|nr:hypothetical protein [Eubacterium sp. An3]OUO27526.1 hypothetical protein B5F87_10830 [Eubacterium sp. An3]